MCLAAPGCEDGVQFFRAGIREDDTSKLGFFLISLSTFRAWVFAKSIFNASKLGGSYGIVGGLAYSTYYTSFFCIALTVYRLRQVLLRKSNGDRFPVCLVSFRPCHVYFIGQKWGPSAP